MVHPTRTIYTSWHMVHSLSNMFSISRVELAFCFCEMCLLALGMCLCVHVQMATKFRRFREDLIPQMLGLNKLMRNFWVVWVRAPIQVSNKKTPLDCATNYPNHEKIEVLFYEFVFSSCAVVNPILPSCTSWLVNWCLIKGDKNVNSEPG